MNAQQLKTELTALFEGLIGTYTFKDISPIPAIWVGQIKKDIPVKEGLEILIPLSPSSIKRRTNLLERRWEITMVQHTAAMENITTAIDRLSGVKTVSRIQFYPISQEQRKSPEFLYEDFAEFIWTDWISDS